MPERRSIRVMHVLQSLDPGGMENGVVNISNANAASGGFEVHICCIETAGEFASRLGDEIRVHEMGKGAGFSFRCVARLRSLIKRVRPDVIHTHNLGPLIYGALAAAGGYGRLLHGEHAQLNPVDLTRKRLAQRRFFYSFCEKIHTVSHALKMDLVEAGLRAKDAVVIRNGVDTARFSPCRDRREAKRKVFGDSGRRNRVLGMVARFGAHKRHDLLIDAFDLLAASEGDLRLLLVGDHGPRKRSVLEQIERSRFRDRILWAGMQNELPQFYHALDMLVSPSTNEGLSNAMLEAMACGVPVLASTACGSREVISHGEDGFISAMADSGRLAEAIQRAMKDPKQLETMGGGARRKIEKEFSLPSMIAQYEREYRAIAGATP